MAKHERERIVRNGWRIFKPRRDHGRLAWRLQNEATGDRQYFKAIGHRKLDAVEEFEEWFARLLLTEKQAQKQRDEGFTATTVTNAFTEWFTTVKGEVRQSTAAGYESGVRTLIADFEGQEVEYVHEISLSHVEIFFSNRADRRGRTKRKLLALLIRILGWCVDHRYAKENVAVMLKPPKSWAKDERKGQRERVGVAFSFDEASKLLDVACSEFRVAVSCGKGRRSGGGWEQTYQPPEHLYHVLLIGFLTGLRLSSITGLRWRHLDLSKGVINLDPDMMKGDERFRVPLHDQVVEYLNSLLAVRRKAQGRAPSSDDHVLATKVTELRKSYRRALARAGLETLKDEMGRVKRPRLHDLRHTFKSWLEEELGTPRSVVSALMGWSDGSLHARYGHRQGLEKCREALVKIPSLGESAPVSKRKFSG